MKIRLADYKEGVVTAVREDYNPKELDLEFVDLRYTRPLHLEGTVEKGLDTLTFRGFLTSQIERTCGRCLVNIPHNFEKPFEFFYEIKNQEIIETLEDLREAVILEYPISFVCREECKGLCPNCGANLNESQCECQNQFRPGTPFSPLKKFWNLRKQEKSRGQS